MKSDDNILVAGIDQATLDEDETIDKCQKWMDEDEKGEEARMELIRTNNSGRNIDESRKTRHTRLKEYTEKEDSVECCPRTTVIIAVTIVLLVCGILVVSSLYFQPPPITQNLPNRGNKVLTSNDTAGAVLSGNVTFSSLPPTTYPVPHPTPEYIPKILHWVHDDESFELPAMQSSFIAECKVVNADFRVMYWTFTTGVEFINNTQPAQVFLKFNNLSPRQKQVDLIRFFVIRHYGGVYIDDDVECVRPLNDLYAYLFPGVWITSHPDPFVLVSRAGESFWSFVIDSVFEQNNLIDVSDVVGAAGLNMYVHRYLIAHGLDRTMSFANKGVLYFDLDAVKQSIKGAAKYAHREAISPDYEDTLPVSKLGFFDVSLFDPCACSLVCLRECEEIGFCSNKYRERFLIHHCRVGREVTREDLFATEESMRGTEYISPFVPFPKPAPNKKHG